MAVIQVQLDAVADWQSMHTALAAALRFPDYYGRNADAFIDCLSDITHRLDVPPLLEPGEPLTIVLNATSLPRLELRPMTEAVCGWAAFVNWRDMEEGLPPKVVVAARGS